MASQQPPNILISCSNCRAYLMDVIVTKPDLIDGATGKPFEWKVWAKNCPFCDENPKTRGLGGSYPVIIHGGVAPGGYGGINPDNPEDDIESTYLEETLGQDDQIIGVIGKHKNGIPFYARK